MTPDKKFRPIKKVVIDNSDSLRYRGGLTQAELKSEKPKDGTDLDLALKNIRKFLEENPTVKIPGISVNLIDHIYRF